MSHCRTLNSSGRALLLTTLLCMGCRPSQPAAPGASTKGTQTFESAFWVSGWGFHLLPIDAKAKESTDKSKEVWRNLFVGMAADVKTRELLTRLHGGWPTELVVVEAKQARDQSAFKAPPSAETAVVLRVAELGRREVATKAGVVPFLEIAYSRVIRIKDAAVSSLPIGKSEPLPGDALEIAVEEYVLRHAPGWVAARGTGPDASFEDGERLRKAAEEARIPPSVDDERRELDRRIEEYANQAKSAFGAVGGRK
jgi:hypothetical protein